MFAKQSMQRVLQGSMRMQAARNALAMGARPVFLAAATQTRAFSDATDGSKKLGRALEKEIKYENENYAQLEDIETFLNESGFAFSEEDAGIFMTLKKQIGDKIVEVTFEARQPIPDDQQVSEDEQDGEDYGPQTENYCDFTIYITDSNGKSGMVVEATTVDTEINYNSVQMTSDVSEQKKLHRLER
mmetsp:Transcript_11144/g.14088  ORF Transcript_11144/g.14088 Transcript_11144/m.14088 type:complete len:187 (+) Transcript_11144:69-629(+)